MPPFAQPRVVTLFILCSTLFLFACSPSLHAQPATGTAEPAMTDVGENSSNRTTNEATIRVPQDYATIQAAIDAAVNDDVIVVAPGTYDETPELAGKRIILASEFYLTQNRATIDQTIIDGGMVRLW
jgi:hypothetical protein